MKNKFLPKYEYVDKIPKKIINELNKFNKVQKRKKTPKKYKTKKGRLDLEKEFKQNVSKINKIYKKKNIGDDIRYSKKTKWRSTQQLYETNKKIKKELKIFSKTGNLINDTSFFHNFKYALSNVGSHNNKAIAFYNRINRLGVYGFTNFYYFLKTKGEEDLLNFSSFYLGSSDDLNIILENLNTLLNEYYGEKNIFM